MIFTARISLVALDSTQLVSSTQGGQFLGSPFLKGSTEMSQAQVCMQLSAGH